MSNRARNARIDHWIAFVVGINGTYWQMGGDLYSGQVARLLSVNFEATGGEDFNP